MFAVRVGLQKFNIPHNFEIESIITLYARWIREGKLHYRDEIVEGIEQAPSHLLRLFSGEHRGKLMVKLADPEV